MSISVVGLLTEIGWIVIGGAFESDRFQKHHCILGRALIGALTRTQHVDQVEQIVNVCRWLMNCAHNGATLVRQCPQQLYGIKGRGAVQATVKGYRESQG